MSFAIDEFGRPFIIIREQLARKRVTGLDAIKSNIHAAKSLAAALKTSFGPNGMDKILVSKDGEVTITNDGAEILDRMEVDHEIGKLIVQLSKSQDTEVGDGTTGVVILAGALLAEALPLLEKKIHPLSVSRGFDSACEASVTHLEHISFECEGGCFEGPFREFLVETAKTTMCSKLVKNSKEHLAQLCVDAIAKAYDPNTKDINLEMIRVETKVGSSLEHSQLINGIVIDKSMSHSQMKKAFDQPKLALLTCAFEPPKPKTKHSVNVQSVEHYKELYEHEQKYFKDIVRKCKESGADLIFCQWGFDDEANHLLLVSDIPAVRWVGGCEMEALAIATGAKIVGRFEDLFAAKLGSAGSIREAAFGSESEKFIVVEDCPNTNVVTLLLRGGNKIALEEAKRSIHDALCAVRNLVKDKRILCGGGSLEISCSLHLEEGKKTVKRSLQYGYEAFGRALEAVPIALAENQGRDAIEEVSQIKAEQAAQKCAHLGVNHFMAKSNNMKEAGVFESLLAKKQQFQLATQVAKIILKTDDVIKKM